MVKNIYPKYFHLLNCLRLNVIRLGIVLISTILFIKPLPTEAQTNTIKFNRIGVDDGLSQGTIYSICQDYLGFLWFATENGLNRYDGYTFKVYKHNINDINTISSNRISYILEDTNKNLWIGTNEGINLYDRSNDRMIRNPEWPQKSITSIVEDEKNNLWIGSNGSLYYLNLAQNTLKPYEPDNSNKNEGFLSNGIINSICIDSENNVWIGTNRGLNLYNKEKDEFIHYFHDSNNPNSLSNDVVLSLLEDKNGRLWVGTASGLDLFTNHTEIQSEAKFTHYQHQNSNPNSISDGRVFVLFEDDNQNLWVGTENGGLNKLDLSLFNPKSLNFTHYRNETKDNTSLSFNSVGAIFQDKQKNIWIGTMGNGINMINAFEKKFFHIKNLPGNDNSLSNNMVNAFWEDGDYVWVGTEGGLNRYNKNNGTVKRFIHNPQNNATIGSNAVWAICKTKNRNLWIGNWAGGLNLYNEKNETFRHYYHNPDDKKSLSNNNIFAIIEDSKENMWIGTVGGGLSMYNQTDKTFTTFNQDNSTIGNYLYYIIEAKNGDFWIVTSDDLVRFNIDQKKIEHFIHDINDSTTISSKQIFTVFEDSRQNIWVGTDQGINVFIESDKTFKHYNIENGLPDNGVRSILEDNHGNLWLGTYKGLSKFINAINLPEDPKFKNYTVADGIQSNEFRGRSAYKGTDGVMYFGGVNGFNIFYPDSIKDNPYIPDIIFTDFLLFNKPVQIGEKNSPLKKDISLTREIKLKNNQSFFTIKFVALSYNAPGENEYATFMEGLEKDWNYLGNQREITYRNLKPGEYTFRVKASNNDGVWNEEGSAIKLIILPPWWLTWYFKIIYIVVFLALIYALMQIRTTSLRKQKEILEKTVEERTHDINKKNSLLEYQSNELTKINAALLKNQETIEAQKEELEATTENLEKTNIELVNLNATKDKFFRIIAHDLRGPFSSFLGLTELMVEELPNLTKDKIHDISLSMKNSASSLYRLLENLLHWAKIQQGSFSYKKELLNLSPVVTESMTVVKETAENKNITVTVDIPDNLKVLADKNIIQLVIRNLLTNALKFTKTGGKVSISAEMVEDMVNVVVKDTGIGMNKNIIDNLFRLDVETNRQGTNGEPSTGLGLIICKELIEKQGGKLWVESEENVGTVFHFSLESDNQQ